jgi:mRNA-degrading endonuclease toxin of MazEF toxin-antitoxin module
MKPWEIWTYAFPGVGEHPAVIISHGQRVERKAVVEVLLCASLRGAASPAPHEVVLNSADGLDWKTLCRCDLIYSVPRDA